MTYLQLLVLWSFGLLSPNLDRMREDFFLIEQVAGLKKQEVKGVIVMILAYFEKELRRRKIKPGKKIKVSRKT